MNLENFMKYFYNKRYPIQYKNKELYLTNGSFMVVFQNIKEFIKEAIEIKENDRNIFEPIIKKLLDEAIDIKKSEKINTENEYSLKICEDCNGTGKQKICDECDGEKNVTLIFEGKYNNYEEEQECKHCHGSGKIKGEDQICNECYGNGKVLDDKIEVEFYKKTFNYNFIKIINELTENTAEFFIDDNLSEMSKFIFSGGFGAVMPLNKN